MADEEQAKEEDYGGVKQPTESPSSLKERMARFDKEFQIKILKYMLFSFAVLLLYDMIMTRVLNPPADSRFSDILTALTPIFTFLLGMGTQSSFSRQ